MQVFVFSAFCFYILIILFFSGQFKKTKEFYIENKEGSEIVYNFFSRRFNKKPDVIKKPHIPSELKTQKIINNPIQKLIAAVDIGKKIQRGGKEAISSSKNSNQKPFSLFGELLYFKATEDSLDYAERIPQTSTFTPRVDTASQHFTYQPGFRIGVGYILTPLDLTVTWMRYHAQPPTEHAFDDDFGLLATLAGPVSGRPRQFTSEHSEWKMEIRNE